MGPVDAFAGQRCSRSDRSQDIAARDLCGEFGADSTEQHVSCSPARRGGSRLAAAAERRRRQGSASPRAGRHDRRRRIGDARVVDALQNVAEGRRIFSRSRSVMSHSVHLAVGDLTLLDALLDDALNDFLRVIAAGAHCGFHAVGQHEDAGFLGLRLGAGIAVVVLVGSRPACGPGRRSSRPVWCRDAAESCPGPAGATGNLCARSRPSLHVRNDGLRRWSWDRACHGHWCR